MTRTALLKMARKQRGNIIIRHFLLSTENQSALLAESSETIIIAPNLQKQRKGT